MLIALRFCARGLVVELVPDGTTFEELTTAVLFEAILNDNLYLHSMKIQTDIRNTLAEFQRFC